MFSKMILLSFLNPLGTPCYTFPPEPVETDLKIGQSIAKQAGSLEDLYEKECIAMSTWFSGHDYRKIDTILWLSPELLSRWLGYLSCKEDLDETEISKRWSIISHALDGKYSFIVQLAIYPTMPFYDLTPYKKAKAFYLDNVSFNFVANKTHLKTESKKLDAWKTKYPVDFRQFRWWLYLPFGKALTPRALSTQNAPEFPLGDYHTHWYLVSTQIHPETPSIPYFELHIQTGNKTRIAGFRCPKRRVQK
jgi:hypothetical protein